MSLYSLFMYGHLRSLQPKTSRLVKKRAILVLLLDTSKTGLYGPETLSKVFEYMGNGLLLSCRSVLAAIVQKYYVP